MKLVGIIGNAGSGKDTVAGILHNYYNFDQFAFAGILKEGAKLVFGLDDDQVYGNRKEEVDAFWRITPREILQFVGTELYRDQMPKLIKQINQDFWIWVLERKLKEDDYWDNDEDRVVISDVRFANEVDWILRNSGIIIVLNRPGLKDVGTQGHSSEDIAGALKKSELLFANTKKVYHLNNDGDMDKLTKEVQKFSQKYGFAINELTRGTH